jgi:hypothetical protein
MGNVTEHYQEGECAGKQFPRREQAKAYAIMACCFVLAFPLLLIVGAILLVGALLLLPCLICGRCSTGDAANNRGGARQRRRRAQEEQQRQRHSRGQQQHMDEHERQRQHMAKSGFIDAEHDYDDDDGIVRRGSSGPIVPAVSLDGLD